MKVEVFEPDVSPLAVQGPKATDVITVLFGEWVKELKYFGFCEASLDGIPLIVSKSGWSKQGVTNYTFVMGLVATSFGIVFLKLEKTMDIGPGTPNYVERLESGLISFGADTDAKTNPFELGMDRFVDLNQNNDFVGKDALIHIKKMVLREIHWFFFWMVQGINKDK